MTELEVGHPNMNVALILGAGGSSGGAWTRGVFAGLKERASFVPTMSHSITGTSIGAFIAGRIGAREPLPQNVAAALTSIASAPDAPSRTERIAASVRLVAGKTIGWIQPPGRADARTWIRHIEDDTYAQVVSLACRPPARRAVRLDATDRPDLEIAASGAIPLGAKPVEIDGRAHLDGAIWSVSNADLVSPTQADLLIVSAPLVSSGPGGSLVSRSGRHQLRVELAPWAEANKPVIVACPTGTQYGERGNLEQHERDGRQFILDL